MPDDGMPASSDTSVVHRSFPHDSARLHVQGEAAYIDDMPEPAGTLHVACGLSPKATGRVVSLELSAVRQAQGVVAVITAGNIPGRNDIAPFNRDEPVFAASEVMFHGQPLFAVVAEKRDQARRAARLAQIEIATEPHVLGIEDAIAAGARVQPDYAFLHGDTSRAMASAPRRIQGSLRIGGQEHFYLEGQISLVVPGEHDTLTIYASTQDPTEVQHIVARVLGLPDAAVLVETRRMGGAFGGKESQACQWAAIAALAARATGRPCKLRLDRDDDFAATGKRHDFRADWKAGFTDDGLLAGYEVVLNARCGCSLDLSPGVVDRAMFHATNAYHAPAAHITSRRLRTNTVSNTAFRGFGGPQGMLPIERAMDAIAHATGRDPLDIRKANLYGPGRDVTPYGMQVDEAAGLAALIDDLEISSDYRARRSEIAARNATSPWLKRGISLTPVLFGLSFTLAHLNQAGALVNVYQDGSILLNHGGTEMGQGLFVKVAQVVAEEFGVPLAHVRPSATNTAMVPNAAPTAASAGSDLNGMAARIAARAIRDRMAAFAAELWNVGPDQVRFQDALVSAGNHSLRFGELAALARKARIHLSAAGHYSTPEITWDRDKQTGRPFYYFTYGAACSEVVIDTLTGESHVTRVDILQDVGRSINPAIDIGQVEGAFVQGMGWLTSEELVWDRRGRLTTHAPSTYKIPVASDVPADFRVQLRPGANLKPTIYRSKGIGEPPLMLAISVFSAIVDALHAIAPGSQVHLDAPATPERVAMAAATLRRQAGT